MAVLFGSGTGRLRRSIEMAVVRRSRAVIWRPLWLSGRPKSTDEADEGAESERKEDMSYAAVLSD